MKIDKIYFTKKLKTMADLDGLLEFVKYHNLGNLPFNQVIDLWDKDIKQTLEEQEADNYLADLL